MEQLKRMLEFYPESLIEFIDSFTITPMVYMDEKFIIKDCNLAFLKLLGLSKKPLGRYLGDLVNESGTLAGLSLEKGQWKKLQMSFVAKFKIINVISFVFFGIEGGYLLFTDRRMLPPFDIAARMISYNSDASNVDRLTGVKNKRFLKSELPSIINEVKEHKTPLSLTRISLTCADEIYDEYGEETGDIVVRQFACLLKNSYRNYDLVVRLQTGEFLVLMPETYKEGALKGSQRISSKISASDFAIIKEVTTNFGITEFAPEGDNIDTVLERVENALSAAVKKGPGSIKVF